MIEKDKTPPTKMINIFALLGFALFAVLAVWSSYQVIRLAYNTASTKTPQEQAQVVQTNQEQTSSKESKSGFGGFFSFLFHKEKLELKDKIISVKHNQPFKISWDLSTRHDGKLFFSYACVPEFYFKKPAVYNSAKKDDFKVDEINYTVIPCNAPFELSKEEDSLTLIPHMENPDSDEALVVKYAIAYSYNKPVKGKSLMQDIGDVKVSPIKEESAKEVLDTMKEFFGTSQTNNASSSQPQSQTQTKNSQSPKQSSQTTPQTQTKTTQIKRAPVRYVSVVVPPLNNPQGLPDLSVEIISAGIIDPSTGNFIPQGTINAASVGAIKFKVKNLGDKETGPWLYKADLPTYPKYYYLSKIQPSLLPGAEATVIVSFDKLLTGRVNALVNVDPYNSIPERNETNNSANVFFDVVSYNIY